MKISSRIVKVKDSTRQDDTNVESVYPFQVLVTARSSELEHDSKTQAEQVRTISFARVGERLGTIPAPLMLELDEALRIHLSL